MQLEMIGLGRMGSSMLRRLIKGGHPCRVFDSESTSAAKYALHGAGEPRGDG